MKVILFDRSKIKGRFKKNHIETSHLLIQSAAETLVERLTWTFKKFNNVLILGPFSYILMDAFKRLYPDFLDANLVQQFVNVDFDSENIPFPQNTFDCILSFFDFETINDVPGSLRQLYYCLKPNGLFTGVYLGGNSLESLRQYFLIEESFYNKGVGVRFHPTISAEDMAYLLQRSGFECPMTDNDVHCLKDVTIYDAIKMLRSLKMTNALNEKSPYLGKKFSKKIINDDTKLSVLINLIYLTALGSDRSSQGDTLLKDNHIKIDLL